MDSDTSARDETQAGTDPPEDPETSEPADEGPELDWFNDPNVPIPPR